MTDSDMKLIFTEIEYIKKAIDAINTKLDTCYVTKLEFWPVAKIAYGIVGVMGLTLLAAIIKLVLK